jgi:hypothetical protein
LTEEVAPGRRQLVSQAVLPTFEGTERFALRRPIGSGGFGAVYEAFDRERGQLVALKVLHATDPSDLYRFKREFRALCDIAHPNLITLYELFTEPGPRGLTWFFTMELLDGVSFIEHVCPPRPGQPARLPPSGQLPSGREHPPLPHFDEGRLRSTLKQLCEGLAVLHQAGMLHRDIKPSNIRVTSQGRVVLLDFGVVRSLTSMGSEISILGTPAYMSPEQGLGEGLSQASDWYSVGVVLYQAMAGVLPHTGGPWAIIKAKAEREAAPASTHRPDIPADLDQLCSDLLRRLPGDRPAHGEILRRVGARPLGHRALSLAVPGARRGETAVRQLVGRERELDVMRQAFGRMQVDRQPHVVLLHGTSGMGKTALARAFLDEMSGDDRQGDKPGSDRGGHAWAQVVEGRCFERESVPYRAVDGLVDALGRALRSWPPEELAPLLPGHLAALTRLFPVLRSVPGIEQAVTAEPQLADPQEVRRRAFGALRKLLTRLGQRRPLVLFIDDLHWIDLDSVTLLTSMLLPPEAPPLLLVCAYRSEDAQSSQALASLRSLLGSARPAVEVTEVEVGPLAADEAERLAGELLVEADGHGPGHAGEPAAPLRGRALVAAAGGSPFFIEELCRYTRTTDSLSALDASTARSADTAGRVAAQQEALDEVILARLARLPQAARRLVEVLAVAGRPLARSVASRTAGLASGGDAADGGESLPGEVVMVAGTPARTSGVWTRNSSVPAPAMNEPTVVAILRSARMLRTTGHAGAEQLELYHHRLREAVLKSLNARARARLHEALAGALEATPRPDPEVLMLHYFGAGQRDRAAQFAARAAQRAADNLAFEHSARLYRFALQQRDSDDHHHDPSGASPGSASPLAGNELKAQLAEVLAHAGRAGEAAELYLEAAGGHHDSWSVEMQRRAAEQLLRTGRIDEGQEVLKQVVEAVGLRMPGAGETLLSLMVTRLRVLFTGLSPAAPGPDGQPRRLSERDFLRMNVCWTANLGLALVDTLRAAHFEGRYTLLALRSGDPYRATLALAAEHVFAALRGPRHEARARSALTHADALAERTTNPHGAAFLLGCRGVGAFQLARFREALEACDRAEKQLRECSGAMWERATTQLYALESLRYLGELGELSSRLPSRLHEADDRGDLFAATSLRTAILPWVCMAADDPARGRQEGRAAMKKWSREGIHLQHYFYVAGNCNLDLYEGMAVQALRRVQRCWPTFKRWYLLHTYVRRVEMLWLRGRCMLAVAARDRARRRSLISSALGDAKRLLRERAPWASGLARLIRAGAAYQRGDRQGAVAELDAALVHLDEAQMALHAACVRLRLAELGARPQAAVLAPGMDPARYLELQGIKNPARMMAVLLPGF